MYFNDFRAKCPTDLGLTSRSYSLQDRADDPQYAQPEKSHSGVYVGMLRSYWIVALVLGLMWLLATASAQQVTEPRAEGQGEAEHQEGSAAPAGQQEVGPEQDDAVDPLATIEGVERAVRALIPEESAEAREQDRQRDEADLRAQERMVLWTFWMFVAAALSVALTAVGVVLMHLAPHSRRCSLCRRGG